MWNAGCGARVAPRDYSGGDIRRGGGAITVHCWLLSGGARGGKKKKNRLINKLFCKHFLESLFSCRPIQDRPREEEEQRRDMPRRGLPAVAPQLEAHNRKKRNPGGRLRFVPPVGKKCPWGTSPALFLQNILNPTTEAMTAH